MKIIASFASDRSGLLGVYTDGMPRIPRYVSEDFRHFKTETYGSPMIMGRKTFDSLPGVLPGRDHIVLTRSHDLIIDHEHVIIKNSLDSALEAGQQLSTTGKVFIIGGAEIFDLALKENRIDEIVHTTIDYDYVLGDNEHGVSMPRFNISKRTTSHETNLMKSTKSKPSGLKYQIQRYRKTN